MRPRLKLSILVILGSALLACAALPEKRPLPANWASASAIYHSFGDAELQLSIRVEDVQMSENYIAGLRFSKSTAYLVVINPAGLPLFSAELTQSGMTVSHQLQVETMLAAADIFAYLLVCLVPTDALPDNLPVGLQVEASGENFRQVAVTGPEHITGPRIQVFYSGTGPEYERIEIKHGTIRLLIDTLDFTQDVP